MEGVSCSFSPRKRKRGRQKNEKEIKRKGRILWEEQ
jgi:hypothetical protein